MSIRYPFGIFTGLLTLWVIFYCLLFMLALAWPAVREVGTQAMEFGDYSSLTNAMLAPMLLMWCLAYFAAGWVTVKITGNPFLVLVMVLPHFLFAAYNHFYAMWAFFPRWYNVGVVLLVFPVAWFGGRRVKSGRSTLEENS